MKVIFFGSSKYVIPIIEVLKKNFDLALVVTTEKSAIDPVLSYCIKSKVCYYVVTDFRNKKILKELRKTNASLGVLASFGAILPNEILRIFPKGIINIHPSLLPKYRGPSPVQAAILNGDKKTGVTIIKLDGEVDHGPILAQKEELIKENDTAESLYERLFKLSAGSIVQTIELYLKKKITPQEQDNSNATFTKRLSRQDGYIDFKKPPKPEMLHRMIHAYNPWPSAWTKWKMENVPQDGIPLRGRKWKIIKFLPDKKIQVEGKKPMSYKDFLNGYPNLNPVILNLFQDLSSIRT